MNIAATAWIMDSSGKVIQQQIQQQPVSSQATATTNANVAGAVTLSAGPAGQLIPQQIGVPQLIAGATATTPQVPQQPLVGGQAMNMCHTITLSDGQEAVFIPTNTAIPSQAVVQPQQVGIQQAVILHNGQIVQAQNLVSPQQVQVAQQSQAQLQPAVQNLALGSLAGVGQAQGSLISIGGTQYMATIHPQVLPPQVPQMQTVHIPVSTANGQTVYQAVQVPVQSLQPAVQNFTLGNQTITAGPEQVQIKQENTKAEAAGGNVASVQEQTQTEVQAQQAHIPTLNVDSQGVITLHHTPVKGGGAQQVEQTPPQQQQQQQAAVISATGGLISMAGGSMGLVQASQSTSTPQTPTVSVSSLPQTMVTPSSTQNTVSTLTAPTGLQQQQVQSIVLPSGQVVQGIQSPTLLNAANLQITNTGQIVQTPVLNVPGEGENNLNQRPRLVSPEIKATRDHACSKNKVRPFSRCRGVSTAESHIAGKFPEPSTSNTECRCSSECECCHDTANSRLVRQAFLQSYEHLWLVLLFREITVTLFTFCLQPRQQLLVG